VVVAIALAVALAGAFAAHLTTLAGSDRVTAVGPSPPFVAIERCPEVCEVAAWRLQVELPYAAEDVGDHLRFLG
jgi:hypothetical protein